MKTLFHPATLTLVAVGMIAAACTVIGSASCGGSDSESISLFFASTGLAAASGLSTGLGPLNGRPSKDEWVVAVILCVVFGGAWFVIGGFIFAMIAFNHCPISF